VGARMHSSGVEVRDQLKKDFLAAQNNEEVSYLKIEIQNDTFVKTAEGKTSGSRDSDLAAIQKLLEPKKPCFVVARAEEKEKWTVFFYLPDNCIVRDRMVYASSNAALKLGLGAPKFVQDFILRDAKECTTQGYADSRKRGAETDVLTMEERMKIEAETDSIRTVSASVSSKMSGMGGVPIKPNGEAQAAIQAVASGSQTTAVLLLDLATEQLQKAAGSGNVEIDAFVKSLPDKEPRYVLHNFKHDNPDGKRVNAFVFVYYCPDIAIPKMKMFYSSSKSVVVSLCEQLGAPVTKQIETSQAGELTKQLVLDELYPKKVDNKGFSKPKAAGKGGRRLAGGTKFDGAARPGKGEEDGAS